MIATEIVTPCFSIADETTWPLILTARQVSAIYQRSEGGLKKACQQLRFVPAPFQKQPYRWRKADLLRHIDGGRGPLRLDMDFDFGRRRAKTPQHLDAMRRRR